jgi:hypothetical protein
MPLVSATMKHERLRRTIRAIPNLIRNPGGEEMTGFRLSPEWQIYFRENLKPLKYKYGENAAPARIILLGGTIF